MYNTVKNVWAEVAGLAAGMIPAPVCFIAADLLAAYIPMSLLGWKLAARRTGRIDPRFSEWSDTVNFEHL